MENSDDAFRLAYEPLLQNAKLSLALTAAPIAIVLAQINALLQIECLALKIAVTIALIFLSAAAFMQTILCYYYNMKVSNYWAEKLPTDDYRFEYLKKTSSTLGNFQLVDRLRAPFVAALVIGWTALAALILMLVWL